MHRVGVAGRIAFDKRERQQNSNALPEGKWIPCSFLVKRKELTGDVRSRFRQRSIRVNIVAVGSRSRGLGGALKYFFHNVFMVEEGEGLKNGNGVTGRLTFHRVRCSRSPP